MSRMHSRNGLKFMKSTARRLKRRKFSVSFDPDADAAYVSFCHLDRIAHTDEVSPGVLIDYAYDGTPMGIEILPGHMKEIPGASPPE